MTRRAKGTGVVVSHMTDKYPMEEIEAALDVADIARDLVALWHEQKITGLPRAERNAAIEGTRDKLIAAVKVWDDARARVEMSREKHASAANKSAT
jgi:hypothetical protein